MKKKFNKYVGYALSGTAKDTYILFIGNILSAFLGFLFTVLIARVLSVSDFGIFSASFNLVLIIAAVADLGVTPGLIRFISKLYIKKKKNTSDKFLKAGFSIRLCVFTFIIFLLLISNSFSKLLATKDPKVTFWSILISFCVTLWTFSPNVLISRKKFIKKVVVENSMVFVRLFVAVTFLVLGMLSLNTSFWAFLIGTIVGAFIGLKFIGFGFIKTKPEKDIYLKLMRFSGWLGLYQMVSAILNRIDVQMLASLMGSTATGLYSIPSRLAVFIIVLAASYASALSPRMTLLKNKKDSLSYIKKTSLALIPMVILILIWIILARPFIYILFGVKYLSTVNTFRLLSFAMIPYLLSVPAFTTIIYTFKKPKYIGVFSIVQLILVVFINVLLIKRYGINGPGITFFISNSLYALYTWTLIIIFFKKDKLVFEND